MLHLVTLIRYVGGGGDVQRDFPGLLVRQHEDDQTHYVGVVVPDLAAWMVDFHKSDFMYSDYGVVDVEIYPREGPAVDGTTLSPQTGSAPAREGLTGTLAETLALGTYRGKLEPWDDSPPLSTT